MRLSLLVLFCLQYLIMAGNWCEGRQAFAERLTTQTPEPVCWIFGKRLHIQTHTQTCVHSETPRQWKKIPAQWGKGVTWLPSGRHLPPAHFARCSISHTDVRGTGAHWFKRGPLRRPRAWPTYFLIFPFFPLLQRLCTLLSPLQWEWMQAKYDCLSLSLSLSLNLCTHCLWTRLSHGRTHTRARVPWLCEWVRR